MKQRAWIVTRENRRPFRLDGYKKLVYEDTVYFNVDMDAEDVRRSLIDHDRYPNDIRVE